MKIKIIQSIKVQIMSQWSYIGELQDCKIYLSCIFNKGLILFNATVLFLATLDSLESEMHNLIYFTHKHEVLYDRAA